MAPYAMSETYEAYCATCSGSGEGQNEGSTCWNCDGSGYVEIDVDTEDRVNDEDDT